MSEFVIESLTELFHLVKSLIPDEQSLVRVTPNTLVSEALQLMETHRYTQLPVVEGTAVLGVFSYRSFANRLMKLGQLKVPPGNLPVDEFVEKLTFFQASDDWETILNYLNTDDAVLVGGHNTLTGLISTMDVLNYLRQVAQPFVLLAEIELSLRRTIRACVNDDELRICTLNSLMNRYHSEDALPTTLTEMEFNDYILIIRHGQNWPQFEPLFGAGEWGRKTTAERLTEVRDLRNDIFHFKRKIEHQDIEKLKEFRNWLQRKARAFEARQLTQVTEASLPITPVAPTKNKKKWDEPSFFQALAQTVDASQVNAAHAILAWGKQHMPSFFWGEGKAYGSFIPGFNHQNHWHQIIGVWTNGYVELQFQYMRGKPVFDNDKKRRELIRRLNQVPGISVDEEKLNQRPSIPLSQFTDPNVLNQFFQVLLWFKEEILLSKKELATRHLLRYQFWTQLLEKAQKQTSLHANIAPSHDNWVQASAGVRGLNYLYVVRMENGRIELYIDRGDAVENQRIFKALLDRREDIERQFGEGLEWLPQENKRLCKISYSIRGVGGLQDQNTWPLLQEKMIEVMVRFSGALQSEINQLKL